MPKIKKQKTKLNWLLITILVLLSLYLFSMILLIAWNLMTTLKSTFEYEFLENRLGFPKDPTLENYATALKYFYVKVFDEKTGEYLYFDIWLQFGNSLLYAVGCAVTQTLTPCLVAYIVARYRYKFLNIYYMIVIITMSLPIIGALPSEIMVSKTLRLYDTFWGQWIMKAHFLGMYFLVFHAQFKMIPYEYTEAAKIDGASNFRTMTMIIMPLAWSTISTVLLLSFVGFWNDYQAPMLYLPSYPVAAYGIFLFQDSQEQLLSYTPTKLAGITLLAIPIVIVFLVFQNKLMTNLSIGGLKG